VTLTKDREAGWLSYRDFVVDAIVRESETAKSFYLVPADGGALAPYLPGQHLPIRIATHDRKNSVIRCYTLSDAFNGRHYRLTIKRQGPPADQPHVPAGISSAWFHDHLQRGDVLQAKMPNGRFCLDLSETHPAAFIAGGIGVTPMMSMLNAISEAECTREIYFLFALRHGGDHVFRERLRDLRARHATLHMHTLYEQPRPEDRLGIDFDAVGRIDASLARKLSAVPNTEYFLCGPPGMMQAISGHLLDAGVRQSQIRTESFGPSSLSLQAAMNDENQRQESEISVTFQRAGTTVPWTDNAGTLLELAEAHGIEVEFGCRYGDCATCLTPLISGEVSYLHPTGAMPDPGTCLPCSCRPVTSVVLGT
jgi:ferredoxin-NADP reductase